MIWILCPYFTSCFNYKYESHLSIWFTLYNIDDINPLLSHFDYILSYIIYEGSALSTSIRMFWVFIIYWGMTDMIKVLYIEKITYIFFNFRLVNKSTIYKGKHILGHNLTRVIGTKTFKILWYACIIVMNIEQRW